jgi:hypothetical protein
MVVARTLRSALLAGGLILAAIHPVSAATPLAFQGMVPDADGIERSVTFNGERDGTALSGIVTVEGNDLKVEASIQSDGSVVGTVALPNGQPLGEFRGRLPSSGGDTSTGVETMGSEGTVEYRYELGGRSGTVAAPAISEASAESPE